MSDTYEINQFDEVVPYSFGRRSNDTNTYRDATELELQQREEISELTQTIERLENEIDQLKSEEFC